MVRQDKNPYIALTYYTKDMDRVVADLQQTGISVKSMPMPDKSMQRFLISTEEVTTFHWSPILKVLFNLPDQRC
jgi:hypothetical protein